MKSIEHKQEDSHNNYWHTLVDSIGFKNFLKFRLTLFTDTYLNQKPHHLPLMERIMCLHHHITNQELN